MKLPVVGTFARMLGSSVYISVLHHVNWLIITPVPVARAIDDAKPGTGVVWLSDDDPCLVFGEGTRFTEVFTAKTQIMLPKSVGSGVAEVAEVISNTQMKIKKEFGGVNGKVTARIREKLTELREEGKQGLEFKVLPFVDQQEMYRNVYQCLKNGECIGIFPEGSYDIFLR
jgi:glycerol-3-phosphate O-acyltransferase / dihydroxyacetone phosphate acyltransferase